MMNLKSKSNFYTELCLKHVFKNRTLSRKVPRRSVVNSAHGNARGQLEICLRTGLSVAEAKVFSRSHTRNTITLQNGTFLVGNILVTKTGRSFSTVISTTHESPCMCIFLFSKFFLCDIMYNTALYFNVLHIIK